MAQFDKTYSMTIYTGEDVLYEDRPLYKAIVHLAREKGIAGGTVLKGIGGYASTLRGIGRVVSIFASGNGKMPVVIRFVDDMEKLERIIPFLEKHAKHSFVTVEECTYLVTDYMREKFPDLYPPKE